MRVIAGTARHLALKTVPGLATRPTTDRIKETLFNILSPAIPGASFLDLFSGSGAIGIEALSRGAEEAILVEQDERAVAVIRENLAFTRLAGKAKVAKGDVYRFLATLSHKPFSLIFADPPYNKGHEERLLEALSGAGFVDEDTLIIIEASLETEPDGEAFGFSLVRTKDYKTNRHLFFRKKQ